MRQLAWHDFDGRAGQRLLGKLRCRPARVDAREGSRASFVGPRRGGFSSRIPRAVRPDSAASDISLSPRRRVGRDIYRPARPRRKRYAVRSDFQLRLGPQEVVDPAVGDRQNRAAGKPPRGVVLLDMDRRPCRAAWASPRMSRRIAPPKPWARHEATSEISTIQPLGPIVQVEAPDRLPAALDDQPFAIGVVDRIVAVLGLVLLGEEGFLRFERPSGQRHLPAAGRGIKLWPRRAGLPP